MKRAGGKNRRLRKMYVEEAQAEIVTGHSQKVVKPSRRREMAQQCGQEFWRIDSVGLPGVSRSARRAIGTRPSTRLRTTRSRTGLLRLTDNNRNWGFGLCFLAPAQRRALPGTKRVYRIYRAELNLRIKPRKRLVRGPNHCRCLRPSIRSGRWTSCDQLEDGRSFRLFSVIDASTAKHWA